MLWVTMTSCEPPVAVAAASAPSFEDWLNDLSSSWPTSVTTPTLSGVNEAAAWDAGADAGAEAGADTGGCDAGADADGLGVAPGPQAETMMARPANRVRPRERCRMCPPRSIEIVRRRPGVWVRDGPAKSRRTSAPQGDPLARILPTGEWPGKCVPCKVRAAVDPKCAAEG